jgi:hypothetical protein
MAEEIRVSLWLFPALEIAHVAAIALVLGSIARVDLRLVGLASRQSIHHGHLARDAAMDLGRLCLGDDLRVLLFVGQPLRYVDVAFFDAKIILILLAGLNMLAFEYLTRRSVGRWDRAPTPPLQVRVAGGLSLAFWISVVICGRLIGFV